MVALDGSTDIEMFPLVETTLQMPPHILCKLPEQGPEQPSQQWPGQIQPFLSKVITVIFLSPAEPTHEKLVDGVPNEETLLRFAVLFCSDVREYLLLENTRRVPDTVFLRNVTGATTTADEIQCDILPLNNEGLLERWPEQVHHFSVGQVVNDVLNDITIRNVSQSPEDDDNRDVRADVW